jgi:predicted amidohydrolase YtcJ
VIKFCSGLFLFYLLSMAQLVWSDTTAADLVLSNGRVYTVNAKQPWASAVAVVGDKIVYVGDDKGLSQWRGETTQQIDLQGKFLLPGFVDSHSHIFTGGAHIDDLLLDSTADVESWLRAIKEYHKKNPDKDILMGSGFLASSFGLDGPNKAMLDAISPDKPIFILDEGMHGAWLNSAALTLLNIDASTPDPAPGFDYYKRDQSGEPTGYLLEGVVWQALEKLGTATIEELTKGTADVIRLYNRYGITAVFDAGPWEAEQIQLDILERLEQSGQLTMRFKGSQYLDSREQLDTMIDEVLSLKQQTQNKPYHIDTLKIMVDGTTESRTAAMFVAYQGEPENFGETVLSQQELNELVAQGVKNKLDIHFHALGERAISYSLDAIEAIKKQMPDTESRFTISHIQVMADKDIARFSRLGVIAQSSLLWTYHDTEGEKFLTRDQFDRYYRHQSLLDTGAKVSFGCDFPSHGGGLKAVAPLFNIEIGHTRQAVGQPDAAIQPRKEERLGIADLLYGYTMAGAYQLRLEDEIGSIEVGKKADMVLLSASPFEVDAYKIHDIKVLNTWLGGNTVYSSN